MLAKDIMTTNVITVNPSTTIGEAMKMLVEIDITGFVVLNDEGEMAGIVSEKDLMVAYDMLQVTTASIENYISNKTIFVTEDTPIEDINKLLIQENIRRVPVVRDKKLMGIITRKDIIRHILDVERKKFFS